MMLDEKYLEPAARNGGAFHSCHGPTIHLINTLAIYPLPLVAFDD